MLKGGVKGKFTGPFAFAVEAQDAFKLLKERFTDAPMLKHFNPERQSKLETDASGHGLSGILTQLDVETGQWHPVAFWSRKMESPERNYPSC